MPAFTIEIAGVPAEIKCRFPKNKLFFRDYFTDKTPLITVQPSGEDLKKTQEAFDRMDAADGLPKQRRPDVYLENNAIHSILAEKLVAHNVLLIHGSALCMDGQAVIFVAFSGTGKSTHARLWREAYGDRVWMINDDKPMLRFDNGKVDVYGTPWDGKHHLSRNASVPLKAVVCLTRDETNHIEALGKADAFSVLTTHAYLSQNPQTMMQILDMEKQLTDAVACYRLGCNMSPEAAEVARQEIFN